MVTAATPTAGEKVVADADELPKAIVRRLVKDKLSQLSQDGGEIQVLKDSLLAFSESSRIFIHYLSATANDICKESKRQTINAEDVFKALEEIEFPEFVASLRTSLEGNSGADSCDLRGIVWWALLSSSSLSCNDLEFKRKNAKRKSESAKSKEAKKSKTEEPPMENGEAQENGEEDRNDAATAAVVVVVDSE
ncbi:Histone-fold [Cynara cardunculus var. scolymus]|uniref:Histone-fold n=1 Tax=Cynara cardunculus var. scolymus TaxID=59895 RepID=A0A103MNZ6_CYNCS|nr:Histone-fold [Cynara cardunculus var. scolymus]